MRFLLIFCCLLPLLGSAQSRVDYEVYYSPRMAAEGLRVQVSVRRPQPADSTYFHYASQVWGEPNHSNLHELRGAGASYRFRLVPDSNRIVVYHPRTRNVRFSYALKQPTPSYDESVFGRPRITDTYFHVVGEGMFVVPEFVMGHSGDSDYAANIRWVGFPKGYTLHNNLGSGQTEQQFRGKLGAQFFRSLYVGGDYRVHRLPMPQGEVYVALRDQWQHYDEARLLRTIQTTIGTQREFWQDTRAAYYTVVLSPTVTRSDSTFRGQSIKGTALHQGFMLQSSNNAYNSWDILHQMFNHEMMHYWIGGQIDGAHGELNYWFTEGFTDYYALKNRLRSGEWTLNDWLTAFNKQVIGMLYQNSERNQPNYLIKDNFWKSRKFEKLPYRRGALFAFWLDNQILKKSNNTRSLDDLMRELRQDCLKTGQRFTDEQFLALAQRYVREDLSYFFQKHLIVGADLPLNTADLIEGFAIDASQPVPVLQATGPADALRERYLNRKPAAKTVARQ